MLPTQKRFGTHLDHRCDLSINAALPLNRLSSIICTIGPACKDVEILEKMMEAGMNIARLNFSHGTHEYHEQIIKNLRQAADNYWKRNGWYSPVAIALDTKGSEIRTGILEGGPESEVLLKNGGKITITTDKSYYYKGSDKIIYVDYENITKILKAGNKIFIDDGLICLKCLKATTPTTLECEIENGGYLGSCKGVNLPDIKKDLPTISNKDKMDLEFGAQMGVDIIFASFTRNAAEVRSIRKIIPPNIKIVAKIENMEGIDNMDEIIETADGILIDRGDLGMEIGFEKVFLAQKAIIAKCNKVGKPIVIATHFMESMTEKPRPTRAESSDVANAILDGADCVMLSGETAKGAYPVICVETMDRICREAENAIWQKQIYLDLSQNIKVPLGGAHTMAIATVQASIKCVAAAIIVVTRTGKSAEYIAKYRPRCPILAVTRNAQVARQLHLFRGIFPLFLLGPSNDTMEEWMDNVNLRVQAGIEFGQKRKLLKPGCLVIIATGWQQTLGYTNTMTIEVVQ